MNYFKHFRAALLTLAVIGGAGAVAAASLTPPQEAQQAATVQVVKAAQPTTIETVTVTGERRAS